MLHQQLIDTEINADDVFEQCDRDPSGDGNCKLKPRLQRLLSLHTLDSILIIMKLFYLFQLINIMFLYIDIDRDHVETDKYTHAPRNRHST